MGSPDGGNEVVAGNRFFSFILRSHAKIQGRRDRFQCGVYQSLSRDALGACAGGEAGQSLPWGNDQRRGILGPRAGSSERLGGLASPERRHLRAAHPRPGRQNGIRRHDSRHPADVSRITARAHEGAGRKYPPRPATRGLLCHDQPFGGHDPGRYRRPAGEADERRERDCRGDLPRRRRHVNRRVSRRTQRGRCGKASARSGGGEQPVCLLDAELPAVCLQGSCGQGRGLRGGWPQGRCDGSRTVSAHAPQGRAVGA